MSINLTTATPEELKAYALNDLDLSLKLTMKPETMIDKIVKKCKELNIPVPEASVGMTSHIKKRNIPTLTINIAKQDKPGGAENVFVGWQGISYSIPRGIDIEIHIGVEGVLKNALQNIVTQDLEGERHEEEVRTCPYQIIKQAA